MQADDPPYLSVGTAVSAKYKGAFCEAKVSKVVRVVKCKVTYKMGLGNATVSDEQIKGTLRVGQTVQVKHPDKKELVEATITKIQDCSQYTVVFDDGDITTLRRTALCLKSGRHFNESETLDQLPLTHPEHFLNPVVGGRRGRRNRLLKEDSSEGEIEEENEPDLEGYSVDIGRVVSVETTDKKRGKDNWFPGLVVIPSAQPTVRINVKDEYLVRSFRDGRYYTVPKKEVSDFNREIGGKVESSGLGEAVQKALKYLDQNELPVHWERNLLFNSQSQLDSDSEENLSDSSDDKPCEEKDRFVAQLYKFMDDAGTPLNRTPTVGSKDIDLHRLFREVRKLGGYNRVTNQNKWRFITSRLRLPNTQSTCNQVKSVYKKCLLSYESFYRTLGVTMLNHTRPTKKNRGRALIRDRDRVTPVNSPRPEKDDELIEKKEETGKDAAQPEEPKAKRKLDLKKDEEKKVEEISEISSGDTTDQSETVAGPAGRPKRSESKSSRERKIKMATGEKVKALVEKFEGQTKKDEEEKVQQTRSKSLIVVKPKEIPLPEKKTENKAAAVQSKTILSLKTVKKVTPAIEDEKKQRGRKRLADEKTASNSDSSATEGSSSATNIKIGDKLKVYYGPTHESKVTYEAKVIEIDKDQSGTVYLVHYTGWNTRYDEWITPSRVAENLSATTKAKRVKQGAATPPATPNKSVASKVPAKRGRTSSAASKTSTMVEAPRSTTPSSITSSSSRTKSPGVPATRSTSRMTGKQDSISRRTRRISTHTEMSNHSESETDASDSDSELTRTRSGVKMEETEVKTYKRKPVKVASPPKVDKQKDNKEDEDTEKEDDPEKSLKRSTRKIKRSSEKSGDESEDDDTNPPKGRDFDLNQIRSELKGFTKVPPLESLDKDAVSSSDDSTNQPPESPAAEDFEEKKEKPLEKSSSSEDIYEFKEPEPFEFETRSKLADEKNIKKRLVPRIIDDLNKSPKKKTPKSPGKGDGKDNQEADKKRFRRTPLRKQEESEDEDFPKKEEDPFDKLVESPSFNLVKTSSESPSFNLVKTSEKLAEAKAQVVRNILEDPLTLFGDLPDSENIYDFSRDMELSDCESNTNIFSRESELFSDTFSKSSPDRNPLDLEFQSKSDDCKMKDSDEDDLIRAQIQRVIARSPSTDDDSDDLLLTHPTTSYQAKKRDMDPKPLTSILGISTLTKDSTVLIPQTEDIEDIEEPPREPSPMELEPEQEKSAPIMEKAVFSPIKHISPALQETDSSLLESIVAQPVLLTTKLDDTKEFSLKTGGTKIADSILQKFNLIKSKAEGKSPNHEPDTEKSIEIKKEVKSEVKLEETKEDVLVKQTLETRFLPEEIKTTTQFEMKDDLRIKSPSPVPDTKKRRKTLSRQFIEDSDSDSDPEQLVIARSDDESQSISLDIKPDDMKESDSNLSLSQIPSTDDSQSQEEERNFKFDDLKKDDDILILEPVKEKDMSLEPEQFKEEEPDSHLLLLCEETIPRSPAPATENSGVPEAKPEKSVMEMPFASAPGTSSNSKSMLLEHKNVVPAKPQAPLLLNPLDRDNRADASVVLENTPPTTPESTISNMSPRGDNDGLSPNLPDADSSKSNEELDYPRQRLNSNNKVSPYSEEDTQMTSDPNSSKKLRDEAQPAFCRKRRKSSRTDENVPLKRGRRPVNRSRHNSDSDDTSEHSTTGSTNLGRYERSSRSPRPSKYNFFVEFDPSLDSAQRIAVLQQKLSELRKTYADVKAELAAVERRRKKIRRREREALKASKQEMACA